MEKIASNGLDLLNMYGYGVEDLVLDPSKSDEGTISYVKVDSITYPIDTESICRRMTEDHTSFCILADDLRIHIFKMDGISATEVGYLPIKDHAEEDTRDIDFIKSRLSEIMKALRSISSQYEAVKDLAVLMSMAIVVDEKNEWDTIESESIDDWDSCLNIASELIEDDVVDIGRYGGEHAKSQYLTLLLRFRDLHVSRTSTKLAKALIDTISNYDDKSYFVISDEMCNLLLSLSKGRTEYNGICCSAMAIEATESKKNIDLIGFHEPYFKLVDRISGSTCKFNLVHEYPKTEYDTILTYPAIMDLSMPKPGFVSRTSEGMAIESAISRIADKGRVCAMIPPRFLSSLKEKKLRSVISDRFHISAIIEIKKPFRFISINMILLLLDSEDKGVTVISRKPLQMSDSTTKAILSAVNGNIDNEMFLEVEQSSLDDIWTPSRVAAFSTMPADPEESVELSEIAEIIRGCNIPSSKYHPDGSISGIPYLRVSNIREGKIDLDDAKKVSSQDGNVFSKEGDIVFSIQGIVGKMAICGKETFIPGRQIALIRPHSNIDSEALLSAMESDYFRQQIEAYTTGSFIKGLSTKNLANIRVILTSACQNEINYSR